MNSSIPWRIVVNRLLAMTIVAMAGAALEAAAREHLVYFGTYTGGKSRGIYVSRFDDETGSLSAAKLAAGTPSPSFLAVHPRNRFLYAVNELNQYEGQPAGSVTAFAIDSKSGNLTAINTQSSRGGAPCHIVVDKAGRNVLVANYSGGSVAVFPVQQSGGIEPASSFIQHAGSSVNKSRQEAPHAHGIYLDSRDLFAYVPDLGLDRYLVYRFDPRKGALTPASPAHASVAPGSGPRHFALHPSGAFAYGINEMLCTVTSFKRDAKTGALAGIDTVSTLPPGEAVKGGFSTAELFCHPGGRFLYGSNRGHDTIVVYSIDPKSGRLSHVENASTRGRVPRSFGIDPGGRWLLAANQDSDNVFVFRVDPSSGRLTATGQSIEVGSPVSVLFVPAK